MKNWLKENLVLAIGLALPVLLIVLFFVASVLPKSMSTPPQYELLFSTSKYEYQHKPNFHLEFTVKNNQLMVKASKFEDKNNYNVYSKKLLAYDPKTETMREIAIDDSKFSDGAEVVLDETKNMQLDSNHVSPDGYALEGPSYNSSGLLGGLFGGGYRNNQFRLKKGGAGYKIPNVHQNYYYDQMQFLGWVVKK
jgi:hypothetical protein